MPNRHIDEAEMVRALQKQRPRHHPDFDKITYILQVTDLEIDRGTDVTDVISRFIDPATLAYIADQRAIRALDSADIDRHTALWNQLRPVLGAMFVDGWINGRQFAPDTL